MGTARKMTLDEIKTCSHAYLLYDEEDPIVHFFERVKTTEYFVQFRRKLRDFVTSEPHLFFNYYDKSWIAFYDMPGEYQIILEKRRMYGRK